ncbi:type I polyketide synthase [Streptomyces sp. RPA4-5]|uniref:type I polyketide synthase n=1 Tax=Streptomyces sp. RPA4-5 TaxID=2721245 RepID=UPI002001DF89|nr:type I polyketide synthase [Streptomyces sp. RPA4-5]
MPTTAPPGRPDTADWAVLGADDAGLPGAVRHPDLAALTAALDAGAPAPAVVVRPVPAGADAAAVRRTTSDTLDLLRDWLAEGRLASSRLVLLTRGAVGETADLAGAAVHGLVGSAQAEHPGSFVLVDRDPAGDRANWPLAVDTEPRTALRDGEVLVPRLVRTPATATPRLPESVLITGGTGTLGGLVARHLATRHQVRSLVLLGRRGIDTPGAAELVEELRALGAEATVVACDAADRDALAAVLDEHPVEGVVHAAGVIDDGTISSYDSARLAGVLRPKVDAALHLHELTADRDLGLFVLFSSAAGTLGPEGQAAYAAANATLDALAARRAAAGLPAVSLGWGLWTGASGMTGHLSMDQVARASRIAESLDDADGLALFDAAVGTERPHVLPIPLRPAAGPDGEVPPLLRALVRPALRRAAAETATGTLAHRLACLTDAEQTRTVAELLATEVAAVLGHAGAAAVEPGRPFKDLGFDSLLAVRLRNRLQEVTDLRLPATLVFDHPTPAALAEYVRVELLGRRPAGPATAAPRTGAGTAAVDEPIAIVGMSCRYPGGVTDPEQLWTLLAAGGDGITSFPTDRGWDVGAVYSGGTAGGAAVFEGGFLHDAARFDAGLFGISPREARAMDPQQRLLLEVSWEAFESAGLDPTSLRGSRTGVYAGLMYHDYATGGGAVPDEVQGFLGTGNAGSVASGRVAYTFGLEGPAVTVDTACSSSLVAMHQAAQALRSGDCDLALAGGVTVLATPSVFTEFSRQGGLAADGRCKAFSSAADGSGWSEGVGLLVLERLSDARRNGHEVLAVVRGSAVNQDGASNGLTAPNGPSQERVIRQALANAGLTAADVDAVEAHGTGTRLGDPIEAQALLATYGQDRTGEPLWLGSVKTNIGHTQAAAGVAGVIKMVLAMRRGVLPATLHVDAPSPHVDWSAGAVELLTEARPWPETDRPRRAGVSSFGISGTNAHVIVESVSDSVPVVESGAVEGPVPWVVSGRTPAALSAQAERLREFVAGRADLTPAEVGGALLSRAGLEHRAVVLGADRDALLDGLGVLGGEGVVRGRVVPGDVVFVFPGQGSQWVGMARELADVSPVFAGRLAECEAALAPFVDWSLTEVLREAADLERVDVVQPVLWAVMVSLAEVWRAHGVEPSAVVGHSQGEIAAAVVAGALSVADGARVVALRSRALIELAGGGGMVSVAAGSAVVEELIAGFGGRVSVAAFNGPSSTVVSGEPGALDELAVLCEARGVRSRRIPVDYASHSAQVDRLQERILQELADISPVTSTVPLYSTLTGAPIDTAGMGAEYWFDNLRSPVWFEEATGALLAAGRSVFVECSPHPVLTVGVQETAEAAGVEVAVLGTLRRGQGGPERVLAALAEAWTVGVAVDVTSLVPAGRRVELPTYAFQRERYWLEHDAAPSVEGDPVEARFWDAVEREDLAELSEALELSEDGALRSVLPVLSSWRQRRRVDSVVDSWRYEVTWKPLAGATAGRLSGRWLLVSASGASVEGVEAALVAAGAEVVPVSVDGVGREELAARIRELLVEGEPAGVVSMVAVGEEPGVGGSWVSSGVAGTLTLLQALGDVGVSCRLWSVTVGAVSVGRADRLVSPVQAQVWGLGRVAALELPDVWGGLVDLPAVVDERTGGRFAAVLGGSEDQVAVRSSGVFGRRFVRAARSAGRTGEWSPSGTVLVTGGLGALGASVARWLAGRGVPHLVLTGRRGGETPGAAELVAELSALGARVTVAACDVADRDAVAAVLAAVPAELPLTGVVHTAGVVDDGVLDGQSVERFESVLAGKVGGVVHLDELTSGLDLDLFVVFSSLAGTLGSAGQGNYAAANAFLDAWIQQRRDRGLAGLSIAWGAWAQQGLATGEVVVERLRRGGVVPMDPEHAIQALAKAVDHDETDLSVADLDWPQFLDGFTAARPSPLLVDLPEAARRPVSTGTDAPAPMRSELASAPAGQRRQILLDVVRAQAASVLGHDSVDAVTPARAFRELGFDSLTAVELRNRLSAETTLRLPTTLVFDHPTPTRLADHLLGLMLGDDTLLTEAMAPAPAGTDEPVVIVGMSCRFPGDVGTPAELWQLLTDGVDGVGPFPTDRGWDLDRAAGTYAPEGGFLRHATDFDAGLFGISPREALAMDPQQRLLLEASWEAFESAGTDPLSVHGAAVGVFVGTNGQDYGTLLAASDEEVDGHVLTGNAASVLSGRVAYAFGLEGPAMTVDTACSASLVALHLAAQALRRGECELALAGGVTVMSTNTAFAEFARQGGLAADGRCKAFSADADGTGWSEGVGVLVLERLSDALRNGHEVLAVVRGSAVNQDGASNGLTAPNGPSQERVIRQALASAGLSAADVDAVEAHGTGTRLGDPIEAQALLATYGQDRTGEPLWLGSVKSNLGHTQAAAGAAGVIKMVQAMRHGMLPATLHADRPTAQVDWSAGALELLTEARPWPETDRPRRAGVSSFGISGTNAHVILEAAPPVTVTAESCASDDVVPWVVSGRSAGALSAQAGRLYEFLDGDGQFAPVEVAGALAARAALDHRAVVLGSDPEALSSGVAALAAGEPSAWVVSGVAVEGRTAFLFTGQGSQRVGMGAGLYAEFPAFAGAFDAVCAEFDLLLDRPVKDVVFGGTDLDRTVWAQAGLFAVEVATFRLLESWGVTPDFLLGHSIGEIAAAHCAGVLSVADACALVAARGRLMQALPDGGAMLAVEATEAEVRAEIGGRLDVAAVNGPSSVVVSGPVEVVEEFAARWSGEGRKTRRLTVSHAFHSALMEPMLAEFASVLEGLTFVEPQIPVVSNLTGELAEPGLLTTPDYWVRQVREAVRFADGVETLSGQGVTRFVELGPDGVLTALAGQTAPDAVGAPLLQKDRDDRETALRALAVLWAAGVEIDWSGLLPQSRRVELPTYAFQRDRYWPKAVIGTGDVTGPDEARFWKAVESQDLGELAATLEMARMPEELGSVLPVLSSWRQRRRVDSVVDSWRYRATWKPLAGATAGRLSGRWLLVTASGASVEGVEAALVAAGAEVVPVAVDGAGREELAGRLRDALVGGEPAGVVSLLAVAEGSYAAGSFVPAGVAGTLTLLQALGDVGVSCRLWSVTVGAVSVGRADRLVSPVQAQVWGLGRVAALELPDVWGGLVDLPAVVDERTGGRFAAVLGGSEDQVAVRSSGVFGRRFVRAARSAGRTGEWSPSGTVLVTGGLGALGASVARWLAGRGVPHLVLTGRRGGETPGAAELVAELSALGARVTVAACDVADRDAVAAVLAAVPAELPLTGVVHTAGVVDDGVLDGQSVERFESVLAGKVGGVVHLDELTSGLDLDLFVVFSSLAGTLGSAGQGNYAAANAFLDAWIQQRRDRGLAGLSIAWGAWGEQGMATDQMVADRVRRAGLKPMDAKLAMEAMARAVDHGEDHVAIADVDWARMLPAFAGARVSPLLAELPEADRPEAEPTAAQPLAEIPVAQRVRALLDLIRGCAAAVLGHTSAEAVEPGRAFRDIGFDSLTAVAFRNLLGTRTGLRLPATIVFDHPTPTALAEFLLPELFGSAEPVPTPETAVRAPEDEPIAIVGMACRFPGGARTPEALWSLLAGDADAMTAFPVDRGWDLTGRSGSYAAVGGFLDGVAEFDATLFGISPREALAMDPQQRLLLETVWETFESAGIDPHSARGRSVGVFAGTNGQDYPTLLAVSDDPVEGHVATGNAASVLSGRVAYAFGLEGPAMTVDTACSASLVALHLAAQALRRGECELALAGGVTVMSTPGVFSEFDRQGGLAADGRCKAFSADADGTGWGEGVGMLLVERLSDARRNGHEALAVVRGSAVNQDGASNGLTAPNGPAQQRVIRQALANAGLEASEVDAVEAHGTGTKLGDPIEAQALLATYGRNRAGDPLWLGSIKSNIGHTQAAAGVAGVIKMVLAMRRGVLPATLHVGEPSSQVDWSAGAVELLTEARPWPEVGRPRRAGVSSFGISGTNAHIILESTPEVAAAESPASAPAGGLPWPVSAQGAESLRAQAERLAEHLDARPDQDLAGAAWSLATGRAGLAHRAVLLGGDREALRSGARALASGAYSAAVVTGVVREGRTAFLFTGQGSQRAGMGRGLYEAFPVFAEVFDAVCAEFDLLLDRSVRDVVFEDAADLDRTVWAQAGLFAVEVATFRLLESWGVTPDFLLGHSIGEVAAAHCAGVFSLADACALVAARGRLMQALPEGGAMLAVQATEAEVRAEMGGRLDVAAVNGPLSVVVSGPVEVVEEFAARWSGEGRKTRRLTVSHAFHSALMEPMLAEFASVLEGLTFAEPQIPVVSDLTGELAEPGLLTTPGYWVRQVREAVRFADGVEALNREGVTRFVELGPDGVLCGMAQQSVSEAAFAPVTRRDRDEAETALHALARLWTVGAAVDWATVLPRGRRVELPTYAFRHERFWPTPAPVPTPAGDVVESRFWEAVERADLEELAGTLRLGERAQVLGEILPALSSWRRLRRQESVLDSWRYQVTWKPVSIAAPELDGRWLVVVPDGADPDLAEGVRAAIRSAGAGTVDLVLDPTDLDRAALSARILDAIDGVSDLVGTVLLAYGPTDGRDEADRAVSPAVAATLVTVQALGDADLKTPLWTLTRGAVRTGPGDLFADPAQAQVWGLGRVAALEHPQRWGGLIDLPQTVDTAAGRTLAGVLGGIPGEDQVAVRAEGAALVRRLVRVDTADGAGSAWSPSRPGTVLVTGGTGALGAMVARWLAESGVTRLLLTGRRGPESPGAAELVAELAALGTEATVATCDVADRDALAAVLAQIPAEAPLIGVVHAAGVLDDGTLDSLTPERFTTVMAAKVSGLVHLDELTGDLDFFVAFSSLAGTIGSAGQGNYAAANAFLDAWMEHRHDRGLPGLSVAWGPWAQDGMATGQVVTERLRRSGVPAMDPSAAVGALARAIGEGRPNLVVADIDWPTFAPRFAGTRPNPLMRDLAEFVALVPPVRDTVTADGAAGLRQELAGLPAPQRQRMLLDLVRDRAAAVLGRGSADAIAPDQAFRSIGFDSLIAVEFRNLLHHATGLSLPATLVFDHPTPTELGGHLDGLLLPEEAGRTADLAADLDRLEARLLRLDADERERADVAARLQGLLARLAGADKTESDDALDDASADEVLDLIRKEFGGPA